MKRSASTQSDIEDGKRKRKTEAIVVNVPSFDDAQILCLDVWMEILSHCDRLGFVLIASVSRSLAAACTQVFAKIRSKTCDNDKPFHLCTEAAKRGYLNVLRWGLDSGYECNEDSVIQAIAWDNFECFSLMLKEKVPRYDYKMFYVASVYSPRSFRYLMDSAGSSGKTNNSTCTVLSAIRSHQMECLIIALNHPLYPHLHIGITPKLGGYCVYSAIRARNGPALRYLFEKGCRYDKKFCFDVIVNLDEVGHVSERLHSTYPFDRYDLPETLSRISEASDDELKAIICEFL